jgi:hypothetical protein
MVLLLATESPFMVDRIAQTSSFEMLDVCNNKTTTIMERTMVVDMEDMEDTVDTVVVVVVVVEI